MRYLIIMRHAKTEIAAAEQRDFDRNLIKRGEADAHTMGQRLKEFGIKLDCMIASSAQRTQQTAQIVAKILGYAHKNIVAAPQLYLCSASEIENEVLALSDDTKTAMIIGHNPGISEFIYETDKHILTKEIATAGLVVFSIQCKHWIDFPIAKKKLELYDYPKKSI